MARWELCNDGVISASDRRRLRSAWRKLRDVQAQYQLTLAEVRKARRMTRAELAKGMGVSQPRVSELEQGANLYLSTLARCVEALGGNLEMAVTFGEQRIQFDFSDLDFEKEADPQREVVPAG